MKKLLLLLIFLTGCTTATNLGGDLELSNTSIQDKYNASIIIKEDYILEGTKFIKEAVDINSIQIEIGNDTNEFTPDFKISRWEDEVWFKMKPRIDAVSLADREVILEAEKIKFITPGVEYHAYDLGVSAEHPEGAYEFEVILLEKPTTNIITFDIETQGLDFGYQSEEFCNSDDILCPENVIGSYAVYHSTKGGVNSSLEKYEYRNGKVFHIYRPRICDSKEWCVWGELNIDTKQNIQTVIMPEDFWNNAVYPVRHATGEIFGDNSTGASNTYWSNGYIEGSKATPEFAGTVTKITAYQNGSNTTARAILYEESSTNITTYSDESSFVNGWTDFTPDNGDTDISIISYWIVIGDGNGTPVGCDSVVGAGINYSAGYDSANTPPSTIGGSSQNYRFPIYATYTPSGGAETPPTERRKAINQESIY